MSNYTKTVDFASKDTLPSGDSGKIIKGTEFETEFDNIATAVATKADSAAPTFTGTSVFANLDISGDIDVDGTTNLDAVDIDGAVQADGTVTVGVDDTGYDVKFFGATSGKSLLWDESADSLIVTGTTTMTGNSTISGTLGVTGVLTGTSLDISGNIDVDGTTNLDVVDIDGAVDMATTLAVAGNVDFNGDLDVDGTTNLDATNIVGALDVTGSVTAKGASGGNLFLTSTDTSGATGEVLGDINFVSGDASGGSSGTMAKIISLFDSNGDNAAIKIQTGFSTGSGSPTLRDRALFASNGDVSLYEDTGTTAKLHWSASAESLAFGSNLSITSNEIDVSSGDLTLDVAGNIVLNADSGGVYFNDGATEIGLLANTGNNFVLMSRLEDKDIIFKGKDGSSTITALTLDMSEAGAATFSGEVLIPEKLSHTGDTDTHFKFAGANDIRIVAGGVEHAAFDGTIVFNQSGSSTMDFRVESDTQNHMLFVDASLNRIGIANVSPATALDVNGAVTSAGLHSTTAGSSNFIAGVNAGNSIVSGGNYNTVVGDDAGTAITEGDFNTALGYGALIADTKGARSVALGYRALASQNFTTATNNFNVAIGHNAGGAVLTGIRNTLLGGEAGDSITTGNYNICIGNADVSASDASGQLVVGQGVTGNANSSFCFGIDATDSAIAFGATTITAPSDERYKEEITDATAGLSFVNDLRPVTFKWKKAKDIPVTQKAYVEGSEDRVMNDYTNHGFIAQEVKTVIDAHPEIKDGFDMWMEDDADGRQRLGPAALIPVLVKAIQELTARIETLEG